jgi:hypothetical protein
MRVTVISKINLQTALDKICVQSSSEKSEQAALIDLAKRVERYHGFSTLDAY